MFLLMEELRKGLGAKVFERKFYGCSNDLYASVSVPEDASGFLRLISIPWLRRTLTASLRALS